MSTQAEVKSKDQLITIRIPLVLRKHNGRKQVVTPDGAAWAPLRARINNAMVRALARAFRWRRMLETGIHGTIEELAAAEKINPSYVSRVLRLTLLAPAIVEAILDGRQSGEISLEVLMKPLPMEWERQRSKFKLNS